MAVWAAMSDALERITNLVALLMALGMAVSESLVARTGVACRDDTN